MSDDMNSIYLWNILLEDKIGEDLCSDFQVDFVHRVSKLKEIEILIRCGLSHCYESDWAIFSCIVLFILHTVVLKWKAGLCTSLVC